MVQRSTDSTSPPGTLALLTVLSPIATKNGAGLGTTPLVCVSLMLAPMITDTGNKTRLTDKMEQEQTRCLHAQKLLRVVARALLPLAQHPRNLLTAVIYYYSYEERNDDAHKILSKVFQHHEWLFRHPIQTVTG